MSKREFFKATRPDGTDFATGTVKYELGAWTPLLDHLVICGRGYHVADAPAETLIGGDWPCRLFRAEVKGRAGRGSWNEHPHKGVYRSIRVVEELPAWQALGPNGEAVVALIDRAKALTPEEAKRLSAARKVAGYAAGYAARDAAWGAARNAARDAAGDAARDAAGYATRYAAWSAARYAAWSAARDAALALLVRDVLAPEHFDRLTKPWRDAGLPL